MYSDMVEIVSISGTLRLFELETFPLGRVMRDGHIYNIDHEKEADTIIAELPKIHPTPSIIPKSRTIP